MSRGRVLMIVENNAVPDDRRVWMEANALSAAGFKVTVISPRSEFSPLPREIRTGVRILRYNRLVEATRPWQYPLEYLNALFWELVLSMGELAGGIEFVHFANPPDLAFVAGGVLRLFGKRVVFDQHDLGPELYEAKYGRRGFVWRLLLACERLSYRVAHVVITTNESMRRRVIERGGRSADDVFVVRNGPKLERLSFEGTADELRNGRPYLVCYMGLLDTQDGTAGLVDVVEEVVTGRGRDDVQFLVVGDGPGLEGMKEWVSARGLSDHVTFTGFLSGDRFWSALNTADVCVVPEEASDLNDKSTLMKVMDYMVLAKPVVQFDLTEARVTSGDTAVYVPPGDQAEMAEQILVLLEDPERREELGRRAAERVSSSLAWEHQVPHLIAAYEAFREGDDRG